LTRDKRPAHAEAATVRGISLGPTRRVLRDRGRGAAALGVTG